MEFTSLLVATYLLQLIFFSAAHLKFETKMFLKCDNVAPLKCLQRRILWQRCPKKEERLSFG
jgi:hypothetical protein